MDQATTVIRQCPRCGKILKLAVSQSGLDAYHRGELLQVAFPELSSDEREIVKTGICPDCWKNMWGKKSRSGRA